MYTVHGRSILKDDCESFWNRPVYELKEKCKTCNEMSKLHEPSVSINDEQTVTTIDEIMTEHCTVSCCIMVVRTFQNLLNLNSLSLS